MRISAVAGLAVLALSVSACAMSNKPATPAAAAPPANSQPWGEIVVADQALRRGNVVVVQHAELTNGGFIVIHEMGADGKPVAPGNIGYRAMKPGDNKNIAIRLTKRVAKGAQLMAMLHDDTGMKGKYEFAPGATNEDKPTIVNGAPVTKVFMIK